MFPLLYIIVLQSNKRIYLFHDIFLKYSVIRCNWVYYSSIYSYKYTIQSAKNYNLKHQDPKARK